MATDSCDCPRCGGCGWLADGSGLPQYECPECGEPEPAPSLSVPDRTSTERVAEALHAAYMAGVHDERDGDVRTPWPWARLPHWKCASYMRQASDALASTGQEKGT